MLLRFVLFLFNFLFIPLQAAEYNFDYYKYLIFHWKGALTSHSIVMNSFPTLTLMSSGLTPYLIVYTKPTGITPTSVQTLKMYFPDKPYSTNRVEVTGLTQETEYFYSFGFTSASSMDFSQFQTAYTNGDVTEFSFKTFGIALKPYSFTFGAASCAKSKSNHKVFRKIANEKLNFFIHLGDLHYDDIDRNSVNSFYTAYHKVFSSANQRLFFESTPVFYQWDDHDFGPNDAKGTSPSRNAALIAYTQYVPYNPLKNYLPEDDFSVFPGQASQGMVDPSYYLSYNTQVYGIFRSFLVGRCFFIIMDLRSFMEVTPGDILGEEQRNWLENQIRYVGNNAEIKMVFLISSIPWIDTDGGAAWEDFKDTQEWIGDLVEEHVNKKNKKIMMIAGDAHMLAFDDGRNNKFGGFPVVQSAALDRRPKCKGGPYSHGISVSNHQYSVLEVSDNGGDVVCVKLTQKKMDENFIEYDTCHPELYPSDENHTCPLPWYFWAGLFGGLFILALIGLAIGLRIRAKRRRNRAKRGSGIKKGLSSPENNNNNNQALQIDEEVKEINKSGAEHKND